MIELRHIYKSFDGLQVLDNLSLKVSEREMVCVIGAMGCGKSTLLRCLAGLVTPDAGEILFHAGERPRIGMIFQRFNLFPFLNVLHNLTLAPMQVLGMSAAEAERLALEQLESVGLAHKSHLFPNELSVGQQQRVAIARALVNRPKVLLLDEPLAALDLRLRKDMQNELKRIQQAMGITFVYVTHDQEEALSMSDTVVVMDKGRIQQIGRPEDIYNEPKNAFVADFIGESNILDGIMLEDYKVKFFGRVFNCLDAGFAPNEPVDVVIRPEDIDFVPPEEGHLVGTVTSVTFKGLNYDIIVDFRGFKWLIQTTDHQSEGSTVGIRLNPEDIHVMKKSEYSGMFGDYSSYSAEYDELMEDADDEEE